MEIRRLKTKDVFKFRKILKKINENDILTDLLKKAVEETETEETIGVEIIGFIIDNLDVAEQEILEFLGDICGLSSDEFLNLDLIDVQKIAKEIAEKNNLTAFLKAVGKLMNSK